MPYYTTNQTAIFYTDTGRGRPILFIHGLGASSAMFEPQVAAFRTGYRVLCPDLRGSGQSGRLTGPIATILDRQCDDIADLLDYLELKQVVLCGVSYGGVVTYHFALRHPDKVRAIIITDSAGDTDPTSLKERLIWISLCTAFWLIALPARLLQPIIRAQYRRWPLACAQMLRIVGQLRKKEAVLQHFAILRTNHTRQLARIHCPALGIVGNTLAISLKLMQRAMQKIARSELYVITNAVDPTNLCQPANFNRLVQQFLHKINWTSR